MHDSERTEERNMQTIVRWYVASLRPAAHGLKEHLAERRTIAEVLARRRRIELALASARRSRSITSREMRARAARYRELAKSLVDPLVVDVVESCAYELEAEVRAAE
jgi:hypothetical protein